MVSPRRLQEEPSRPISAISFFPTQSSRVNAVFLVSDHTAPGKAAHIITAPSEEATDTKLVLRKKINVRKCIHKERKSQMYNEFLNNLA